MLDPVSRNRAYDGRFFTGVCMAVAGPQEAVFTLETGSADRQANMQTFAATALGLLLENLSK